MPQPNIRFNTDTQQAALRLLAACRLSRLAHLTNESSVRDQKYRRAPKDGYRGREKVCARFETGIVLASRT
jgi:hypothetical protein